MPTILLHSWAAFPPARRWEIHALRRKVFCGEQGIDPALEFDGLDDECEHAAALDGADGPLIGTLRLRELPAAEACRFAILQGTVGKLGRLAVIPSARRQGLGRELMAAGAAWLDRRGLPGVLHAQAHLEAWYASQGWRRVGPGFAEAGIPHVEMVRGGG